MCNIRQNKGSTLKKHLTSPHPSNLLVEYAKEVSLKEQLRDQLAKAKSEAHTLKSKMRDAETTKLEDSQDLHQEKKALQFQVASLKKEMQEAQFQLNEQINSTQVQGDKQHVLSEHVGDLRKAMEAQEAEFKSLEHKLRQEHGALIQQVQQAEHRAVLLQQTATADAGDLMDQITKLQNARQAGDEAQAALMLRAVTAEAAESKASGVRREMDKKLSLVAMENAALQAQVLQQETSARREAQEVLDLQTKLLDVEKHNQYLESLLDKTLADMEEKTNAWRVCETKLRNDVLNAQLSLDKVKKDQQMLVLPVPQPVDQEEEEEPVSPDPSQMMQVQALEASLRSKNEQVASLRKRIVSLEKARDALVQEIQTVTQRVTSQKAQETDYNEILLQLCGEKEEELDVLREEMELMREEHVLVKNALQSQLEDLLKA